VQTDTYSGRDQVVPNKIRSLCFRKNSRACKAVARVLLTCPDIYMNIGIPLEPSADIGELSARSANMSANERRARMAREHAVALLQKSLLANCESRSSTRVRRQLSKRSLCSSMGRKNASGSAMWNITGTRNSAAFSNIGASRSSSTRNQSARRIPQTRARSFRLSDRRRRAPPFLEPIAQRLKKWRVQVRPVHHA